MKVLHFLSGLIVEGGSDKISLGRVSWWCAFLPALWIWVSSLGEQDITANHLTILLVLAGYNLGKKAISKFQKKEPADVDGPG